MSTRSSGTIEQAASGSTGKRASGTTEKRASGTTEKRASGTTEKRRKPEAVRRHALEVGRRLLIEGGPGAVTLKAIGAELGMSHANLIHHFGSADALRTQLKDSMVRNLTRAATVLVRRNGRREVGLASIVDQVFDTYASGGIGMLLAWTAMTGNEHAGDEPAQAIRELLAVLRTQLHGPDAASRAQDMVSLVTLLAFANSLIGGALAGTLDSDPDAIRGLTARLLRHLRVGETPQATGAETRG